jgi:hypothetical protein
VAYHGGMAAVPDFRPSTHGFAFANSWPRGTTIFTIDTPFGDIRLGDANAGLCGGMAMAAADLYQARRRPPAATAPPARETPLFGYLSQRLLASWNVPTGPLTFAYWALTPDRDTGFIFRRSGVSRMTIRNEIPQITASIDRGRLCLVGMVTVRSAAPDELAKCHIALAYAYERTPTRFRLSVYDPNRPGRDDIGLGLDVRAPHQATPIDHNLGIRHPVRGFFLLEYTFRDPTAVAGPPY